MQQDPQAQNGKIALVALGSNAASISGGPHETVVEALKHLKATYDTYGDFKVSRFYQTPAFPAGWGPDFVNAACCFSMTRDAAGLLDDLHDIEARFGRARDVRWGQRTLDLDLIACGGDILPDVAGFEHWRMLPIETQKTTAPDRLILPHPRLQDRPFVLVPLADVAPDWVHPVLGLSVRAMLDRFDAADLAQVTPI